jgi:hypothetical protein
LTVNRYKQRIGYRNNAAPFKHAVTALDKRHAAHVGAHLVMQEMCAKYQRYNASSDDDDDEGEQLLRASVRE